MARCIPKFSDRNDHYRDFGKTILLGTDSALTHTSDQHCRSYSGNSIAHHCNDRSGHTWLDAYLPPLRHERMVRHRKKESVLRETKFPDYADCLRYNQSIFCNSIRKKQTTQAFHCASETLLRREHFDELYLMGGGIKGTESSVYYCKTSFHPAILKNQNFPGFLFFQVQFLLTK